MTKRSLACVLLLCGVAAAQWVKQSSGTRASLRGVKAVSHKICWVSGTGGTVLKTTDGGDHWQVINVAGAEKLDFRDIEAPNEDANTAVIMSSGPAEQGQAKIFKTTDGGEHWKLVFSTDRKGMFFDSIAFWDKQHGIGLSDPVDGKFILFATDDGGDTWHVLTPQQMPAAQPGEGGFAASGTTIAVAGKHDAWFGTGGAKISRIFHSKDEGKTWTAVEAPIPAGKPSAGIFSVAFRGSLRGAAVGGDYQDPTSVNVDSIYTTDGGLTWKIEHRGAYLSSVAFGSQGQIVSDDTSIHETCSAAVGPTGGEMSLNAISFAPGSERGWAVGPRGIIYATHCRLPSEYDEHVSD